MERDIKVVIAELDHTPVEEPYADDSSCNINFSQRCIQLDELFSESWFVEYLRNKGYYSKDEVATPLEYLDNFVYEYKSDSWLHSNFLKSINGVNEYYEVIRVYQEVVGPERIKVFAKWKLKREKYLKQQEEIKKKNLEKQEAAKERRKLKEIAKAKQILEQAGELKC